MMRGSIGAVLSVAARWLRLKQGQNNPQKTSQSLENAERYSGDRSAEWADFQNAIREIHRNEEQHQTAERTIWAAQLLTAQRLNRITCIGAIVGAIGSIGIIGSLIIAKHAADDGHVAVEAAKTSADIARAGTRAWIAPAGMFLETDIAVGKPLMVRVHYANLGKEPALNVRPIYRIYVASSYEFDGSSINSRIEEQKICEGVQIARGADVTWPNPQGYNIRIETPGDWVTKEMVDGSMVILVSMCFSYNTASDPVEIVHHTSTCYFHRKGRSRPGEMNICNAGLYAD